MKSIAVKCEACGAEFKLPPTMAGFRVSCSCGNSIVVGGAGAKPAQPAPASAPAAPAAAAATPKEEPKAAPAPAAKPAPASQPAPTQRPAAATASPPAAGAPAAAPQAPAPTPPIPTGKLPEKEWFFSASGLRFGPLTLNELRERLRRGDLKRDQAVYHDAIGGWRVAGEVPQIWSRPPHSAMPKESWHVNVAGKTYGPYPTSRVWDLIEESRIARNTMVWARSLGGWKRIGDVPAFASGWASTAQAAGGPAAEELPPIEESAAEPATQEEAAAIKEAEAIAQQEAGAEEAATAEKAAAGPPAAAGQEGSASITVDNLDAVEGAIDGVDEQSFGEETVEKKAAEKTEKVAEARKEQAASHAVAQAPPAEKRPEVQEVKAAAPEASHAPVIPAPAQPKKAEHPAGPPAAPAPPPTAPPEKAGVHKELWYYFKDGKREGPVPLETLQKVAREGKIGPKDKVWSSTTRTWIDADGIPALAVSIAATTVMKAEPAAPPTPQAAAKEHRPAVTPTTGTSTRVTSCPLVENLGRMLIAERTGAVFPPNKKRSDVAHVPSAVLTVEYVDDSEGMDSGLKAIEARLAKLEKLITEVHETNSQLVTAVNQQAKDVGALIESLNRRVDRVYRALSSGAVVAAPGALAPEAPAEQLDVPQQFASDAEHQEGWRIAQVMASDLEAYYADKVREGVLYQNFFELLAGPIGEAKRTYEERVSERVRGEFDYFTLALKKLVAAKAKELSAEAPK